MGALYLPAQFTAFQVLCSTIPPLVALVTILRLWIKQPRRWWYDDLFVTLGVCAMITQQGVLWERSMYESPTLPIFYTVVSLSQTQVWLARFSLLCSVVRIAPTPKTKLFTQMIFGLFLVMYIIVLAQLVWVCQTHLRYVAGVPTCVFTTQIPAYQFTAAMVADGFLCVLPIRTIMQLKGDRSARRRLIFIFAASLLTTTVSLTQAILNLKNIGFGVLIAAEMECWVSLLVCNFGVVFNAALKWARPDQYSTTRQGRTTDIEISVIKFSSTNREADQTHSVLDSQKPLKPQESFRNYAVENQYSVESMDSKLPM